MFLYRHFYRIATINSLANWEAFAGVMGCYG
jgi:hypothetical protein